MNINDDTLGEHRHNFRLSRIDSRGRLHHYYTPDPKLKSPSEAISYTIARRLLPAMFLMLLLLAGAIFLIYAVALHQAVPPIPAIIVATALATIIILVLLTNILVYLLGKRIHQDGVGILTRTKMISERWNALKESLLEFKKTLSHLCRKVIQKMPTEENTFRSKWQSWIDSHPKIAKVSSIFNVSLMPHPVSNPAASGSRSCQTGTGFVRCETYIAAEPITLPRPRPTSEPVRMFLRGAFT